MKKLNTNGFSAVEAILIIVVVVLIAGVGYYVYQGQNKHQSNINNSATSEPSENNSASQEAKFSVSAPAGWIEVIDDSYGDRPENLAYKSPDYKDAENTDGAIATGGAIAIQTFQTEFNDIKELMDNSEYEGEPNGTIITTLDGVQAYRFECGHTTGGICIQAVKDNVSYTIWYQYAKDETATTAKYLSVFNTLAESFKFQ